MVMLADEAPERGAKSAKSVGGSPVTIMLYVENVDQIVEQATQAGAILKSAVADQFYGDRMGTIVDPFGHTWHVATHVEDVSPEEMKKRMAKMH
jgi:PhnB protein